MKPGKIVLLLSMMLAFATAAMAQGTPAPAAEPKLVIASGDCACHGGEFGVSYASCGAIANVIPVDVKIAGCPPSPAQLLAALQYLLQSARAQDIAR